MFYGSAGGLAQSPAWSFEGTQANALLGHYVFPGGDWNGDGFGDVTVGAAWFDNGAIDEGKVWAFYGPGLAPSSAWVTTGGQAGGLYGLVTTSAGDTNADGYADLLVGTPAEGGSAGAVRLFLGDGDPLAPLSAAADWTWTGTQPGAQFGAALAAGDLDGDGHPELALGAPGWDGSFGDEGRVELRRWQVEAGGLPVPLWETEGGQAGAAWGTALALGDFSGDGHADLAVGAPVFDNGQADEGTVQIFLGGPEGPSMIADQVRELDQAGAQFGAALADAGDVNGDGRHDLMVSAPAFDWHTIDGGNARLFFVMFVMTSSFAMPCRHDKARDVRSGSHLR